GVKFIDSLQGWLVSKSVMDGKITLLGTGDGGKSWQVVSKLISQPEEVYQIASASLEFIDLQTGFIAFKLHSSSNFSLGRLLATTDRGFSWQERSLPLGEPVNFQNAQHGWISGGPQDRTYFTEDGGQTWTLTGSLPESVTSNKDAANLAYTASEGFSNPMQGLVELDIVDDQTGWAIVQDGSCTGYKLRAGEQPAQESGRLLCESSSQLLTTSDGGESWQDISPP
ncbi:MAG: hypothetical protein JSV69_03695, partial [Chloroflexota bacterium]